MLGEGLPELRYDSPEPCAGPLMARVTHSIGKVGDGGPLAYEATELVKVRRPLPPVSHCLSGPDFAGLFPRAKPRLHDAGIPGTGLRELGKFGVSGWRPDRLSTSWYIFPPPRSEPGLCESLNPVLKDDPEFRAGICGVSKPIKLETIEASLGAPHEVVH